MVFKFSLQTLFSSINSLQITAHLPLINITFSSSSYFIFDILISFVVFDFLPMDLLHFGFTQTEHWSEQFSWLGYDSGNYVELMGSLIVFFLLIVLQGFFILTLGNVSYCKKYPKLQKYLDTSAFKLGVVVYFYEALLELILCGVTGFKLWEIRSIWTRADKIAFGFLIVMNLCLIVFMGFLFHFLCCRLPKLVREKMKVKELI